MSQNFKVSLASTWVFIQRKHLACKFQRYWHKQNNPKYICKITMIQSFGNKHRIIWCALLKLCKKNTPPFNCFYRKRLHNHYLILLLVHYCPFYVQNIVMLFLCNRLLKKGYKTVIYFYLYCIYFYLYYCPYYGHKRS